MALSKLEKAEYDRNRRAAKADQLRAYDNERNAARRKDPTYNEAQIARKRAWREKNRDRHLAKSREYEAIQRQVNPQRRISKNMRHRIAKAMMGKTRGVSAVSDLGMSIPEFRDYIASKFRDGMSWENYGEWHLDHIRPLISFDLTDRAQALVACNFSNYQPLWASENHKKGAK